MEETQSPEPTPETQSDALPGASTAEPGPDAERAAASIASDLRELGLRFTAALKAAANTPEARELRGEVREGLSQLRDEIDGTLENLRSGAKRRVEERRAASAGEAEADGGPAEARAGKLAEQVRVELAQAVRNLSAALDKMAGSVEGAAGDPGASETDDEPEIVVEEVGQDSGKA